jgi:hypothetical protein
MAASNDSGEIEIASVQYARFHVPESRLRGRLGRQCQHLRGNVGGQDRAGRPNPSGRREGLLPGASSYVEHAIANADPGQVQHPLGQRREDLRAGHAGAAPSRGRLNRSVRSSGLILDAASGCHGSVPRLLRLIGNINFNVSHAARCVACHGVRSHPVPVALVGECSIPVV